MSVVAAILAREQCPKCGHRLALSLAGVPVCFRCRRVEHGQIDRIVATGREAANEEHERLLAGGQP